MARNDPSRKDPSTLIRSGVAQHRQGQLRQAARTYARVLKRAPDHPDALHLLGLVHHQQGEHQEAARLIRRAVQRVPEQPTLLNNLGDALRSAGEPEEAARYLRQAIDIQPDHAGAHMNLGTTYGALSAHDKALYHARKAVELAPDLPEAHYNLALELIDHHQLESAADHLRKAIALRPTYLAAGRNLLYLLNLIPNGDPQQVAAEHQRVCRHLEEKEGKEPSRGIVHKGAAERPLRVGYLSRDFRAHAVNAFLEPVLERHDRARFEIYCYSDVEQPDAVTDRLRGLGHHWRDTAGWDTPRLCRRMGEDGIDILVDLVGHTGTGRLELFAKRAAPIQVNWLGYPNTIGLSTMDYRIVDHTTAPEGEPLPGHETPLRLPEVFSVYRPPAEAPEPSLPASQRGVTFGSLHKLDKLNPEVIALWSRLLHANPGSRLLIARDALDEWNQQWLKTAFARHQIDPSRLELRELKSASSEFLECFSEIDLLLDTFPWSGHTLACHALWMGVPVVTLRGETHAGRMVASLLRAVGLEQMVADSEAAYLEIASALAAESDKRQQLRTTLRSRVAASPLCDEVGFTRALEAAYQCIHRQQHENAT